MSYQQLTPLAVGGREGSVLKGGASASTIVSSLLEPALRA